MSNSVEVYLVCLWNLQTLLTACKPLVRPVDFTSIQ